MEDKKGKRARQKKEWKANNKEKLKAYQKKWYAKNKVKKAGYYVENIEHIKKTRKEVYNKEENKKKRRERYLATRDEQIARATKWAKDNAKRRSDGVNKYFRTNNGGWRTYRSVAKRRGLQFELSLEEYSSFRDKNCHYCDAEMEYIGLDRIDSAKGYKIDNVVPCCKWCNTMKNTYSTDEFVEHCKKIASKF